MRQRADINAQDIDGMTALHIAVSDNNSKLVAIFLSKNAGADIQNTKGNTPLHIAIQSYTSSDIVKNLLDYRAQTNIKNMEGNTPLHILANQQQPHQCYETKRCETVQLLLMYGADLRATNIKGRTPTQLLASSRVSIAQIFLAHPPPPLNGNRKRCTSVHCWKIFRHIIHQNHTGCSC